MKNDFLNDLKFREEMLKENSFALEKEKSFYDFVKASPFYFKVSDIQGSYENGFKIIGSDYSLVDDFKVEVENVNYYKFLSAKTGSKVYVSNFI